MSIAYKARATQRAPRPCKCPTWTGLHRRFGIPNRERARYQAARYSSTLQLTIGSKSIDYPVMYGGGWCGRNLKTCRKPELGQIRLVDWDKASSAQPHHTVRNVANFLRSEVERGPCPTAPSARNRDHRSEYRSGQRSSSTERGSGDGSGGCR